MKRPYLTYLVAVVIPSVVTVVGGAQAMRSAWTDVREHSERGAATMALAAFQHDLGAAVAELTETATPQPVDPTDPVAARAAAGDTASGLVPGDPDVDVRVALPREPQDPEGTVRVASAPIPTSAIQVGRAAGYRTALYLHGRRWLATTPPPGPDTLDDASMAALTRAPEGAALLSGDDYEGALVAVPTGPGGPPALAVLVESPDPTPLPLPIPLLLVMGLLFLFACLAGWIQLTGEPRRATLYSVVLVSLVPTLTAWGFLVQGDRLFHEALEDAERRDLTRALAVARMRDVAQDPATVYDLSGYHSYLIRNGRVEAASLPGDHPEAAALPAPPPSFTSTGKLRTPEGEVTYVALRLPTGGFVAVTAPPDHDLEEAYGLRARSLALALAGWLVLLGGALGVARIRVSS